MEKIDKEEFELMKSNCFWAGRLIDLPKEKAWEIADEIVAAIQYAESQVKNHGVSHHVSERTEAKRKLDDEFTHYEPTMCDGTATMRECENGTYIEREDAHLIIDKYVR